MSPPWYFQPHCSLCSTSCIRRKAGPQQGALSRKTRSSSCSGQLEDLKNEIEKRQKNTAKLSEEISQQETKPQGEKSQHSVSEFLQGSSFQGEKSFRDVLPTPGWWLRQLFSSYFTPFHQPKAPTAMRRRGVCSLLFLPLFSPCLPLFLERKVGVCFKRGKTTAGLGDGVDLQDPLRRMGAPDCSPSSQRKSRETHLCSNSYFMT